jgi:uncharacterized protein YecE (DUF72 family)
MDFGKLPSVEGVNFTLPPEPPQNVAYAAAWTRAEHPAVYLGATGYNMKDWAGKWYPAGAKEKDFLRHYGAQFNTIEHNTTHYRIPDFATVARWREETPDDFRFCPKIPQTISHARDLGINSGQIALFCDAIRELGPKLGVCFLQLPPHFSTHYGALLMRFLDVFPADIPLAVEVRHPSFFEANADAETYFTLLNERNIATVITDVAGRRDVCHMRLTARRVLIRFVGNDLHPTDYSRVRDWSPRLKNWFDAGLEAAYFFTHEPDNLQAPALAAYCAETFGKTLPDARIRGPKQQVPPAVQGSLF